jgi:hypothetical protein
VIEERTLKCAERLTQPSSKGALQISMKYVAAIAVVLATFSLLAQENSEKPEAVVIHPGETLYVTFQRTGDSLTLTLASKDADKGAQLILKMGALKEIHGTMLQVENKFDKNLYYKAEMHLTSKKKRAYTSVVPVIAGKVSFESWPYMIEELALSGFELRDK